MIAYYGLGKKEVLSHKQIGEWLGFGEDIIKSSIDRVIVKIKTIIKNRREFLSLFSICDVSKLKDEFDKLDFIHQKVIKMHYGLVGKKVSFSDIAKKMKLDENEIIKIINEDIKKLSSICRVCPGKTRK